MTPSCVVQLGPSGPTCRRPYTLRFAVKHFIGDSVRQAIILQLKTLRGLGYRYVKGCMHCFLNFGALLFGGRGRTRLNTSKSFRRTLQLLARAVQPQLAFRCSRWPPQRQVAVEVDRKQQKMAASVLRLPRLHNEEAQAYVRRRGRAARSHCLQQGIWSHQWFGRAVAWDDHSSRPRNNHTWAAWIS